MSVTTPCIISLLPPVASDDLDIVRLQQRFEAPLQQLVSTPWGNGSLVQSVALSNITGTQTVGVRHNLGRAARGALIGNCNVEVYGPWGLMQIDNNNCSIKVNLPSGGGAAFMDVWVY